jgi:predicted MPP superfamily phosphohydrolase
MITDEDKYHWHEYKEKLIRLGVIFLDNETKSISNGQSSLLITGISIDREFYKRSDVPNLKSSYLKDLVPPQDPMKYHILIAHNPVYFKKYITWGADLVVAGHLHGGLVRLPMIGGLISPQVKVLPKYDSGKYRDHDSEMIVSRGLGTHSYMLRLFNRPELIKITMKSITS